MSFSVMFKLLEDEQCGLEQSFAKTRRSLGTNLQVLIIFCHITFIAVNLEQKKIP